MLHQAIAKQAVWREKPVEAEVHKREEMERSPRTKKGGFMALPYVRHIEEWTVYAKEEPRCMKELIEKMRQLCNKAPSQASVYHWCEDRAITIRIDRHKTGISKIAREMLALANQGYNTDALIDFAASKGHTADAIQVRSAVSHARRRMRA